MDFPKAAALILSFALLNACKKEAPVKAKVDTGPVIVRSTTAVGKSIQRVVESVGTFFPYEEAIISAEVDGKVDEVKIDLGDMVAAGQILVHIADEEQRYLLAQQDAQLHQSLERLGLKDEKDRVTDVKETPEVRRAAADMQEAEQRFRRARQLTDQGIGAQADLDQFQSRFNSAYDATINQARNLIQEVERYKAVLDLQRKKLRDTTIRAPFAGLVKERMVTVGQFTRANTPGEDRSHPAARRDPRENGPMGASPGIHRPNRKSITTNVLQLNESTRAPPSRIFISPRIPHFVSGNSGREPRAAAFGLVDNGERRAVLGFPIQGVEGE